MAHLPHLPSFVYPNIRWGIQVTGILIIQFPSVPHSFLLLRVKYLLQQTVLKQRYVRCNINCMKVTHDINMCLHKIQFLLGTIMYLQTAINKRQHKNTLMLNFLSFINWNSLRKHIQDSCSTASSWPLQLRFILLPQPRRWSSLYSSKSLASCNSFGSSLSIFISLSASSSSETRFGFPIAAISCSDCGFCLLGSGHLNCQNTYISFSANLPYLLSHCRYKYPSRCYQQLRPHSFPVYLHFLRINYLLSIWFQLLPNQPFYMRSIKFSSDPSTKHGVSN